MKLRFPKPMELWKYTPSNINFDTTKPPKAEKPVRDRYYTQARRVHVKHLMQKARGLA